jgi:hypothetical protein
VFIFKEHNNVPLIQKRVFQRTAAFLDNLDSFQVATSLKKGRQKLREAFVLHLGSDVKPEQNFLAER